MNNLIEQFAKEAGMGPLDYDDTFAPNSWAGGSEDLEKFVRLIIQHCKEAVRDTYLPVLEDKKMMECEYWKGYVSCGVDAFCEIDIKFYGEPDEYWNVPAGFSRGNLENDILGKRFEIE